MKVNRSGDISVGRRLRLVGPADDLPLSHRCGRATTQVLTSVATAVAVIVTATNCDKGVITLPSGTDVAVAVAPMMALLGHVLRVYDFLSLIHRILWGPIE